MNEIVEATLGFFTNAPAGTIVVPSPQDPTTPYVFFRHESGLWSDIDSTSTREPAEMESLCRLSDISRLLQLWPRQEDPDAAALQKEIAELRDQLTQVVAEADAARKKQEDLIDWAEKHSTMLSGHDAGIRALRVKTRDQANNLRLLNSAVRDLGWDG